MSARFGLEKSRTLSFGENWLSPAWSADFAWSRLDDVSNLVLMTNVEVTGSVNC